MVIEGIFFAGILVGVVGYYRKKEKNQLERISRMLDDAIAGNFVDGNLEETKISEIESSMWRFLCDCKTSAFHLEHQQKTIHKLLSDISHQTITPISNIKIYLELLEEKLFHCECIQKNENEEIVSIYQQVDKLDFLIHSLVKLSRLEAGIIKVNPKQEKIQKVLTAVERQYVQKAEKKRILFRVEPSGEEAVFDVKWTEEVIGNIVDNSIKYTPGGGQVTIQTQAYSLFLRIDITDNGIGIEESEQAKIFTRFYRSPSVCEQPGVGIGLFLAREVLKVQKGYIKVTSIKGEGSQFSVFLLRQ